MPKPKYTYTILRTQKAVEITRHTDDGSSRATLIPVQSIVNIERDYDNAIVVRMCSDRAVVLSFDESDPEEVAELNSLYAELRQIYFDQDTALPVWGTDANNTVKQYEQGLLTRYELFHKLRAKGFQVECFDSKFVVETGAFGLVVEINFVD